jgi:hypothetical protein
MKRIYLLQILLVFIYNISINAQINDNFEDGNLDGWGNTTEWSNSVTEPINGLRSLKHGLSNVAANSYIYHDLSGLDLNTKTVVWNFNLKNGDWDPSSTSRFWFYLTANENNLTSTTVDGYAVGIDFGTSNDFLTLWKITNGMPESVIIQSSFDWNNLNLVGISVSRTVTGLWTLKYDTDGNFNNLIKAGEAINADYTFSNYCGLVFNITAARSGQLWLDDLDIDIDKQAPEISSVIPIDQTKMRIVFSEQVQQAGAENLNNYNIPVLGHPNTAILNADKSSVDLTFPSNFIDSQQYIIDISGIVDLSGNSMNTGSFGFIFKEFKPKEIFAMSQNQLYIKFSHPLNISNAENELNYLVNNGIGNPSSAILQSDTVLILTFSGNLNNNTDYQLTINNLVNIYGTSLNNYNLNFTWHQVEAFDLVINEMMVDNNPAPNVLPAAKYIEIYNRSAYNIYLSGWTIQIGDNAPVTIPNFGLNKNSYIILCSSSQIANFKSFGNTIGILTESQLTTTGKPVLLRDQSNKMIDYVNYSNLWYGNTEKDDGGWSLERIDPNNFCGEQQNWAASKDFKGGTPGASNSINNSNTDNSKPLLLDVKVLSSYKISLNFSKNITEENGLNAANYTLDNGTNIPFAISYPDSSRKTIIIQFTNQFIDSQEQTIQINNLKDFCGNTIDAVSTPFTYYLIHPENAYAETDKIVHLVFSEELEIASAQTNSNYLLNNGIGNPFNAIKHSSRKNEVYLEFSGNMTSGQTYSIHIELVKDLDGNSIKAADLSFIYYEPSSNDLVINEILFNPRPSGVDFVEIYNKSAYPIDLSHINIAKRNEEGVLESIYKLSENNFLLYPYHFLAITTDSMIVKKEYPAASYDKFTQISSMPSFNDDAGTIVILKDDLIIDEFTYNADMHFDLITNPEGVSLERLDPDKETALASNWHSAAESYGFASPANQNSQFHKFSENSDDEVVIEPETFSPNSDGYNDITFIQYNFNEPGYVANISVFDSKGRIIKRLVSNELLATQGEFSWDGLAENGSKATIGIYVIYFEVFNLQGVVKKFKKVCVVADRLR